MKSTLEMPRATMTEGLGLRTLHAKHENIMISKNVLSPLFMQYLHNPNPIFVQQLKHLRLDKV